MLRNNHSYGISEQANLECVNLYSVTGIANGCQGGYAIDGLNIMAQRGGSKRSNYPYTSRYWFGSGSPTTPGICNDTDKVWAGIGTPVVYNTTTIEQLKDLLYREGPVTVHMDASSPFGYYHSGLYSGCGTSTTISQLNHLALLTGYTSNSWILKNSWGTDWGNNGYA